MIILSLVLYEYYFSEIDVVDGRPVFYLYGIVTGNLQRSRRCQQGGELPDIYNLVGNSDVSKLDKPYLAYMVKW